MENAWRSTRAVRQLNADTWRVFKPGRQRRIGVRIGLTRELGVAAVGGMMVAAHVWDTMGAQAAGFSGALITRRGNALPADGVLQPTIVAADIGDLVDRLR